MDGKNRAASSYLSPGNPPADKEQNDPLAQYADDWNVRTASWQCVSGEGELPR